MCLGAMALQRDVYEKQAIDGFRAQRVESLALCNSEKKVFAGTVDGTLLQWNATSIFDNPSTP